jgi:hypothetical protein
MYVCVMDVMCAGGVCVPDPAVRQRDGEAYLENKKVPQELNMLLLGHPKKIT